MADIIVDVSLPSPVSTDVTSPTQALATNISVPGPQGPAGPRGFTPLINNITGNSVLFSGKDGIIISSDQNINTIYISGNSGYFQSTVNDLATNLQTTGTNLYSLLTNFSGNLDATYASDLQLYNTGSTLDNKINSLSGYSASVINLASTGSTLNSKINSLSGWSASNSNLSSTGSSLDSKINSLSGYSNNTFSTINNLQSTGSNLYSMLVEFSGNLDATYATDSQLATTGSNLDNKITSLSGYVNFQNSSISNNLTSTGTTLVSNINTVASNLSITGNTLNTKIDTASGYFQNQLNNLDNTYATDADLISTGFNLNAKISALSGTLTGNYLTINSASSTYATITNLAITGNTLVNSINSLSGTLTSNYATIINLENTGSNLNSKINNLSGWSASAVNLTSTGATLITNLFNTGSNLNTKIDNLSGYVNTQDNSISTNLFNTGSNLNSKINSLSGYINTQDNTIFSNLATTGNILDNKINALSGSAVLTYGNQTILGNKTFNGDTYINNLFVTGSQTIVRTNNFSVESPYLLLNLTGGAVDGGIFFVTGNGLTGLNDSGPIIGFDHSKNFKFGVSTRNSDLSSLPDIASVQDIQAYSGVANNTFSTITNLASTGSTLDSKINALSGNNYLTTSSASSTYATVTNLASTGSTLDSKINALSGNNYLTTSSASSTYATVTNLASTGSTLDTKINNLSGVSVLTFSNQTINGLKTFTSGIDIYSGTNPQSLRIFNSTGTNSGEFGLLGWQNNQLFIGAQKTNSGILRDIVLSGANINLYAMGDGTVQGGQLLIPYNTDYNSLTFRNAQSNINYLQLKRYLGASSGPLLTTLGFASSISTNSASTADLLLERDAAGILAQRNGTNSQQFRVYNATGTNSGEFGLFGWDTANNLIIGSQATNSGILRNVTITGANVSITGNNLRIDPNGSIQIPFVTEPQTFSSNLVGMYNGNGQIVFSNGSSRVAAIGSYASIGGIGIAPANSLFFSSSNRLAGGNFNGDIYLTRDSAGILNQYSSTTPQQYRIFNLTGTNTGEFGLFGWQNNQLFIGAQQSQSGILRDVAITGNNINLSASGNINIKKGNIRIIGGQYPNSNGIYVNGDEFNVATFGIQWVNSAAYAFTMGRFSAGNSWVGMNNSTVFGWSNGSDLTTSSPTLDVILNRDAAGILAQRNGTNSQQFRVYNSTGTNSGEFGLVGWINSGFVVGPQQTQSGILRDLILTGNNININASGVFNIFDNTNIAGNLTVSGNTTITGHLSAASKSFLIDHPTQANKKLQYGSLESPYHGIRLTDKSKLSAELVKVELPDYISALVNDEKVNIQLTNINHDKILFVKDVKVNENYFTVGMNRGWFDKNEYEFYWSFTAERKDIPKLTVEF